MVPGLTAAEQCVFRVRAENAHGLSEASAESEPFQMGSDGKWCDSKQRICDVTAYSKQQIFYLTANSEFVM
jgi:hypothetical protein